MKTRSEYTYPCMLLGSLLAAFFMSDASADAPEPCARPTSTIEQQKPQLELADIGSRSPRLPV